MKKLFFLLLVLAGAAGYLALNYHFILFDDSIKILKKTEISTNNIFVDARGAKVLGLLTEPDLISAGFRDLIGQNESYSIPTDPVK